MSQQAINDRSVMDKPLYWRLLRLRAVAPGGVLRVVLVEGLVLLAVVLSLAGALSLWSVIVLPLAGALVVKAHDVLARELLKN